MISQKAQRMKRLQNKNALITGATSGIGLETARQFIAEGANVIITGRSEQRLQQAVAELEGKAAYVVSDASDVRAQAGLAQQIGQHFHALDIVYLNAGDVTHMPLAAWTSSEFDRVFNTNFKAPFFLLQALNPLLNNPASVILCGSVSAHIGLAQSSVYAASKAAGRSLVRTLSSELLAQGIRLNMLSPGPTHTAAFDKLGLTGDAKTRMIDDIKNLVPLKRLGEPVELAKAAVYLASDESCFMVGAELLLDGGVLNL